MADIETAIRKYIANEIMYEDSDSALGFDDPLLESGILDSAGIINLVMHLDSEYSVSIPPDDLVPEHFDTVRTIAELVRTRAA